MARLCAVCSGGQREVIDAALLAGTTSVAALAALYGYSESSVRRHGRNHLVKMGLWSRRAAEDATPSDLIGHLTRILEDVAAVRADAVERGDHRTLLTASRESRATVEVLLTRLGVDDVSVGRDLEDLDLLIAGIQKASWAHPAVAANLAASLRELGDEHTSVALDALAAKATDRQKKREIE